MYPDTLAFPFLGTEIYAYGLCLLAGTFLGLGILYRLSRKRNLMPAAALTGFLALPLGLILARLLFVFGDPIFRPYLSFANIFNLRTGGFAMYGALAGAVLGALFSARANRVKAARVLDILAPALMAFLIPARLGEGFTVLGISRPLTTPWIAGSFLARREPFEAYLRTYALEAFVALVLLIILLFALKRYRRPGNVFLMGCLLYSITQTLMESLRFDGHLRLSFVGIQQVLSAVLFSAALIVLAVRALKKPGGKALPVLSLILLPLIIAGAIAVEFMIDRSPIGKLPAYGLYLLLLAIPLGLGMLLFRREGA
ncbi:MAG: prolipoprotein diacylglyceryl transferase [Eubacteriales bacterium]|nr:prolipoprotein diacylglyceryl transferase [Eubacteriales bacterium]